MAKRPWQGNHTTRRRPWVREIHSLVPKKKNQNKTKLKKRDSTLRRAAYKAEISLVGPAHHTQRAHYRRMTVSRPLPQPLLSLFSFLLFRYLPGTIVTSQFCTFVLCFSAIRCPSRRSFVACQHIYQWQYFRGNPPGVFVIE